MKYLINNPGHKETGMECVKSIYTIIRPAAFVSPCKSLVSWFKVARFTGASYSDLMTLKLNVICPSKSGYL